MHDKFYQKYNKGFMDTLKSKSRNLESMGKIAMYYAYHK